MSTALYRRYRPDTFADVIGQEHVTAPLMTALEKNRVNHAYLFSGPRGCGKTTSARILARCLNCEQGPTPVPCGTCPSCVELANGGPGSLDVIEIDAASHGGVDDARDLRERATFAPTRDRYKIFIIDEAHMVTAAGFNALLKIVEEPPAHIKFIFATTEPEKVIGTIRSRTHHYPFRLVPPEALLAYLQVLCEREHVAVAEGVLPLVIRAGGGSVRDTLSVLDQLMAGAREGTLDYETAIALLGYTHSTLLDEVTLSLHEADGAGLFGAIDRIIQTGLDPRRFVEDILERFRDLIIAKAMPEGLEKILRGVPEDQLEALHLQAGLVGAGELSRWADVTNKALSEMTGATSPRLHLELLAARLMLPGSENSVSSFAARLDRLERHAMSGGELPALDDDQTADSSASMGATPNPGAARQGAAAVREALAAAKARREGVAMPAPEHEPAPQTQAPAEQPAQPIQQPQAEPVQAQQPAQRPQAEPVQAQQPQPPQEAQQAAAKEQPQPADDDPNAPLDPDAQSSLNTGEAADWGATWGPKDDSFSVTTEVQPGPSVPAARPEGVAPFSLVPDPSSGEDLSFGTGVSIDDVKQNPAMAEFARKAAESRAQQPAAPAPQKQAPVETAPPAQAPAPAQQSSQAELDAQRQAAQQAQAQQELAQQEQAQREQAEREAQERAAREQARQEQAQREQAEREAQERIAREKAEREAQERAAREQAQQQQQQAQPAQQQAQQPGAGSPVVKFQQAWPMILQQLQGSSRVLHSMVATYGSVAGFDGRTLTLAFSNTGPIVNLRNRPDLMNTLTGVVSQFAGSPIEVVLTEGGSNPAGGGSPKGERRPLPAQTPAPTKFTKAATSAGVAARAAARAQAAAPAPAASTPPAASPVAPPPATPGAGATDGYASSYDDVPPPYDEPFMDEPPFPDDPYYAPEPAAAREPQRQPEPAQPAQATGHPAQAAAAPEPQQPSAPRSFGGPPVAPKPRLTAGLSARQAEVGTPNIPRPVSSTPLHPQSTTDSFQDLAVRESEEPAPQVHAPVAPRPSAAPATAVEPEPQIPAAEAPQQQAQAPAPARTPEHDAPAKPAPAPETAPGWGTPQQEAAMASEPAAPAAGQRMSRYQQLMNQAKSSPSAPAPAQAAGGWGGPAAAPAAAQNQEPEEFVPSDDDIEVEDSALIGVPAVERLLGGMVIEQRDVNGNVVEIKRSL
ncbi:DNA polymerase III subunit gamma and tau [Glutamicibacter halophytocola]|uniref:DNA polymerase III subunit gamma and tau n=1 Tax=Glutamicibacter TaxID=1742989 RepID=UPI00189671C3|nr:DNA polymerase III subunit gamma and tau [Glutamicibacter halophytocola]MBF6671975.1 DNA polymerase III subunit gamma and tau [Glutamicibacter sp. FBE19]